MFWVKLTKTRTHNIRQFVCLIDVRPFAGEVWTKSVYTGLFIIPSWNRYSWMVEMIVTCGLQMERNTVRIFFYLLSAVCARPLSHCRFQADNPFPPIATAACHDRFVRWKRWCVFVARADPVVEAVESSRYPHKKKIACREVRRSGWPSKQRLVCCNEFGRKWIMGLTSAVSRLADTQSTYQGCKKM